MHCCCKQYLMAGLIMKVVFTMRKNIISKFMLILTINYGHFTTQLVTLFNGKIQSVYFEYLMSH